MPYNIYNLGKGKPANLLDYLKEIEKNLNIKAKVIKLPKQLGDVDKTHSNIKKLSNFTNYNPNTSISIGVRKFVKWYKEYYKIK